MHCSPFHFPTLICTPALPACPPSRTSGSPSRTVRLLAWHARSSSSIPAAHCTELAQRLARAIKAAQLAAGAATAAGPLPRAITVYASRALARAFADGAVGGAAYACAVAHIAPARRASILVAASAAGILARVAAFCTGRAATLAVQGIAVIAAEQTRAVGGVGEFSA